MTSHGYAKIILFTSLLIACSTGSKITGFEYPLVSIKAAVEKHLPGPLAVKSQNGRVYQTSAFRLPLYYQTRAYNKKGPPVERAYAKILILGDKRPYTLQVKIEIEELVGMHKGKPEYVICCRHKKYEQDLLKKIKAELVKRKDNQDFIDDFRPF